MACGGGGCCRGANCESRVAGAPAAPACGGVMEPGYVEDEVAYCTPASHYVVSGEGKPVPCGCDGSEPVDPMKYAVLGNEVGMLCDVKQAAYGDAYGKSGAFLRLLYPDGVKPEQYGDMLAIARVFDKLMRIATDKDALGENPWKDVAGYALLGMNR